MSPLTRRQLLVGGAAAATGAVVSKATAATRVVRRTTPSSLPNPASSGIDHVVVVVMENRSFDHYLGWLPGADGRQAGLTYTDFAGQAHQTARLAPDFQGCAHPDPDLPFIGHAAKAFTTYDRFFCSLLASTYPNREYMHAAQSYGNKDNTLPAGGGFPDTTIFAALAAKGIDARYFYDDLPVS